MTSTREDTRARRSLWQLALVVACAGVLITARASAQSTGDFATPAFRWPKGVWGDGADRLYIAGGNEGLVLVQRGDAPRAFGGPRAANAVSGVGTGDAATVVVIGYEQVGRYRGGHWTLVARPPEARFADHLQDVAVGPDGTAYIASQYGGLHIWDGGSFRTAPYPERVEAGAVAVTPQGRVFVTGRDGVLLELAGQRMQDAPFRDAARHALTANGSFDALWVSPTTQHLWIGTNERALLEVDLATGNVQSHAVQLFGSIRAITGAPTQAGERIVVAAQSELGILEAGRFRRLAASIVFMEGMHVDVATDSLYAVNRDGVRRVPLATGQIAATTAAPVTAAATAGGGTGGGASSTTTTTTTMGSGSGGATGRARGGLRIENVNATGCDMLGLLALVAQIQQAAGACIPVGSAVDVRLALAGPRTTALSATPAGPQAACVQRTVGATRLLSVGRACNVSFRIAH